MILYPMKANQELQKDILDAIKCEPQLKAAQIDVIVKDGIVTLSGIVDDYARKIDAEIITKNITGVKAIVEKIKVQIEPNCKKKDSKTVSDLLNLTDSHWEYTKDRIIVKTDNEWLTFDGEMNTIQKNKLDYS